MDINDIVNEGEGYKQEFKKSLSKLDRSLVAFANSNGGAVFIGIDDDGNIIPTRLTNRLRGQIANIASECDPPIKMSIKRFDQIIVVVVKEGEDKPYACRDGFFIRNGATSQKLSRQDIIELTIKVGRLQFDRMFPRGAVSNISISREYVGKFARLASLETVLSDLGSEAFLESLGVAEPQQGKFFLNHCGILFFTDNPQKFIPQAVINYTRFQGEDKTTVIQRKIYSGNLITQIEKLMADLLQNIPVGYSFDEGISRTERPHYPPFALREAVVNAVMHRDYFETGADICIDQFQDRIEISNPGELIGALTIERLGSRSLRRNPLISDIFHRCGWVEKLGSGIIRIRKLMQEWHLKAPIFRSDDGFFSVTFFGPKNIVDQTVIRHLPERERTFLIERNQIEEPFTSQVYGQRFDINQRTAQKDLAHLIQEGFITRDGSGRSSVYRFK